MKTLLVASIILLSCKIAVALYTIDILLTQFTNPGQKLLNGEDCDYATRQPECDLRFQMCLDFPDGSKDDHNQCGIRGPFDIYLNTWKAIMSKDTWQGALFVKVLVTDADGEADDLVDKLSDVLKLHMHRSTDEVDYYNVTQNIKGNHTRLALDIAVSCNKNWKGPQCDCDVTNRDYICDDGGNKKCNKDLYGPQCDVECSPADGIYEHYDCSQNGTKDCHDDYYGEYCDIYCNSREDDTGHYTCDQNGNTICSKDWCSENCNVFCGEVYMVPAEIDPGIISSTSDDGPEPDPESSDEEIESTTKAGKLILILIIGGVAGALTLLIIGLSVFFCKRKKRLQSAQTDAIPMQTRSTSEGHDNNSRMNEGFNHIVTPVGSGYEDCFPNLAARKPQDCAAASSSNDVYAVPDKKTKTRKQGDLADVSDDMLIVENELYGAASQEKDTQAHVAGGAGDMSDDMLIVDNELYGPTTEVKETQPHKVGATANISDDMLIVDNELYG